VLAFFEARCLQARYFLSVGARKTAPAFCLIPASN